MNSKKSKLQKEEQIVIMKKEKSMGYLESSHATYQHGLLEIDEEQSHNSGDDSNESREAKTPSKEIK